MIPRIWNSVLIVGYQPNTVSNRVTLFILTQKPQGFLKNSGRSTAFDPVFAVWSVQSRPLWTRPPQKPLFLRWKIINPWKGKSSSSLKKYTIVCISHYYDITSMSHHYESWTWHFRKFLLSILEFNNGRKFLGIRS